MEKIIFNIITIAIAASSLREAKPYRWALEKLHLWVQPLSCPKCMAFWGYLIISLTVYNQDILTSFIYALVCGYVANEANKIEQKLF